MKILVVAHDATITGGANRSLLMIMDGLREKYDARMEVLIPRPRGPLNDILTRKEIPWYGSLYFGVTSSIRKDGKDWQRLAKVYIGYLLETVLGAYYALKFRNKGFDLVYTNTRSPVVGAKIAKHLKLPHVVHAREFGAEQPVWGFWDYRAVYDNSDRIILISQALHDRFAEYVPQDKLVTIHNGIESPLGLEIPDRSNADCFNMVLTGRIVPDKGHMEAFQALKLLKEKGYDKLHLYIAGSSQASMHIPWYEESLRKAVREMGLEENVTFCGEVSDMTALRKEMDAELMCAIRETFGRVTVEGMRSGLILIGTNTGGTPEIIEDGVTGLLYQQGDHRDLAEKIEKVYLDRTYGQKLAEAGYRFAQTHFTPEKNVQQVYQVLKSVL